MMKQLPFEMFSAVCEVLDTEDIAQLHLVSKASCEVATPFLMTEIHLIFTAESLDRYVESFPFKLVL